MTVFSLRAKLLATIVRTNFDTVAWNNDIFLNPKTSWRALLVLGSDFCHGWTSMSQSELKNFAVSDAVCKFLFDVNELHLVSCSAPGLIHVYILPLWLGNCLLATTICWVSTLSAIVFPLSFVSPSGKLHTELLIHVLPIFVWKSNTKTKIWPLVVLDCSTDSPFLPENFFVHLVHTPGRWADGNVFLAYAVIFSLKKRCHGLFGPIVKWFALNLFNTFPP